MTSDMDAIVSQKPGNQVTGSLLGLLQTNTKIWQAYLPENISSGPESKRSPLINTETGSFTRPVIQLGFPIPPGERFNNAFISVEGDTNSIFNVWRAVSGSDGLPKMQKTDSFNSVREMKQFIMADMPNIMSVFSMGIVNHSGRIVQIETVKLFDISPDTMEHYEDFLPDTGSAYKRAKISYETAKVRPHIPENIRNKRKR